MTARSNACFPETLYLREIYCSHGPDCNSCRLAPAASNAAVCQRVSAALTTGERSGASGQEVT